jgi:signal transduction histidine kinase
VTHWFEHLPIHRKLVTLALLITAVALAIATIVLSLLDAWRFREAAVDEATTLASMVAENSAVALALGGVVFDSRRQAEANLLGLATRSVVTRGCIYMLDDSLFAEYASGTSQCPETRPGEEEWGIVGTADISYQGREYGTVYVERNLSDLRQRLMLTAGAGMLVFLLAAFVAYLMAERVHAAISHPISALARFARAFGANPNAEPPLIRAGPDELGDLVRSVGEMSTRVKAANEAVTAANEELKRSNEALRLENEERRRVEAEREQALLRERDANRLKDEFLAAVSHELRTPLNAMMGWAQILASTRPNQETITRAVASIVTNAQAQTRVIEDLIDVSRIVTGKLRPVFQPVDVRAIVAAALESVEPMAATRDVRLEQEVPRERCLVAGDRDRLQQVFWNLLSNSVKFTPRGGAVSIRIVRRDGDISVTVCDTGIGIPPAFLPHVFDRFRQADGSMTREHGGLGLGLAIVRDLTELHGGTVRASSEGRDRGASFTVTLPELEHGLELDAPSTHGASSGEPRPSLAGIRAVAVDDNEDAVGIIAAALASAGATVETHTDPEQAISSWAASRADVLVCDLAMPRMGGYELLAHIRRIDASRGGFTPALAVSAHASERHQAESLRAGFQTHLSKPLEQDALIRAVAEVCARSGR